MDLAQRMKGYERLYDPPRLPKNEYVIARVDGCSFSTFTRHFDKPYDELFAEAMLYTTRTMMAKFQATLAYTFSDEITLVWAPIMTINKGIKKNEELKFRERMYGGRVTKWATVLSGFASVNFNYFLKAAIDGWEERHDPQMVSNIQLETPTFDARIFSVPNGCEVINNLIWRARDCWRNAVHGLARRHFSAKQLHNKNSQQQIEMINKEGCNFHDMKDEFKYGVLFKHKQLSYRGDDGEEYVRRRLCSFSLNLTHDAHKHKDELLSLFTQRDCVSIYYL